MSQLAENIHDCVDSYTDLQSRLHRLMKAIKSGSSISGIDVSFAEIRTIDLRAKSLLQEIYGETDGIVRDFQVFQNDDFATSSQAFNLVSEKER